MISSRINNKQYGGANLIDIVLGVSFFVSALSEYLAYGFGVFFLIIFFVRHDRVSLLKAFAMFVLRISSMNPLVFQTSTNGVLRNAVLFGFALSCLLLGKKRNINAKKLSFVCGALYIYFAYLLFNGLLSSSYPIVSLIKLLLYATAFLGVMAIIASESEYPWVEYLTKWLTIIMILSFIVIPFGAFRTRNGHAFQGIFGHPNVFGIFASAYISLVLASNKKIRYKVMLIVPTLIMQYLSESRTGLFSAIIIIAIYLMVTYKNRFGKLFVIVMSILLISAIIVLVFPSSVTMLERFFWKSKTGDLLYSRSGQIDRFLIKFYAKPIIGTGFMTPYVQGLHSAELAFDLYVEEGNLFFGIIGQTGIIGLLLFLFAFGRILFVGNHKYLHLFIAPVVISFGEMVFFSTNSLGLFLYMFYAIFVFSTGQFCLNDGGRVDG